MSVFARLAPRLQQAVVARLGWTSLRPVQELAGEALLNGKNAVVLAPTAGGKTEASMFPVLSSLVTDPPEGVAALYIAPIKALLNNQAERLGLYTEMVGLERFVWHGDTTTSARKQFLRDPAALLMTTPESLEVMLVSKSVDAAALFADLRVVVIDEVHALAGSDRGAHLLSVIERIARLSRHDVQRVGLSATVGNPLTILSWLEGTSQRGGVVIDPPKSPVKRELLVVHRESLSEIAHDAAEVANGSKSLFFCQSRAVTEAVAETMRRAGTEVFVHHSAVSLEERLEAEKRFHHGTDACIACTSTLELGIDVGDLDHVLQHEAPDTVSSFLQRMGRTGRRAGKAANTTFFCETEEGVLQSIALIELAKQGWVENVEVQDRAWPVLVHQLLAMSLAHDGVTAEDAWTHLSALPDFRGIHRAEYDRLIQWMLRDLALTLASGRLVIGPKVERRFGRRNFMELYAVFSSPQSYAVETEAGAPLGTLNQGFVDRLVEDVSCFLLGGRAWLAAQIRHSDRVVKVRPAPRGKRPTWGGFLPQFLGHDLCQQILSVLTSETEYPYLHPTAAGVLDAARADADGILQPRVGGVEETGDELRWWTYAGGRVNGTLRHAILARKPDWQVIPDNFAIKLRGEDVTRAAFDEVLLALRDVELWEDGALWRDVSSMLPNYRLSKFQALMPPWVEREMVASYLLDVGGAWRWLSESDDVGLTRVPATLRQLTRDEEALAARPLPTALQPKNPVVWVDSEAGLVDAMRALSLEPAVGLDVETTLRERTLCLVQLASRERTYVIDALEVSDLAPLAELMGNAGVAKVIHNASFERSVLALHGIEIVNVVDTLELSRERRADADGGHSLRAVCEALLSETMDKREQTSDWTRRPLTASQLAYAALDAEVLLVVRDCFLGLQE